MVRSTSRRTRAPGRPGRTTTATTTSRPARQPGPDDPQLLFAERGTAAPLLNGQGFLVDGVSLGSTPGCTVALREQASGMTPSVATLPPTPGPCGGSRPGEPRRNRHRGRQHLHGSTVVDSRTCCCRARARACRSIAGPLTAPNALEVSAGATGATVDGFTVTHAGNNTTDWGAPSNQGVALFGTATRCATRRSRGIATASSSTARQRHDPRRRDRLHPDRPAPRDDVTGLVVQNNFITDNWTIGVLLRDEGPRTRRARDDHRQRHQRQRYSQVEARSAFSAPR